MTTWSPSVLAVASARGGTPIDRAGPIAGPIDGSPCRRSGRLGRKRAERQTHAQVLRAIRRTRAELSQADRMAIEAGGDVSVRVRFKRDVTAEPGGQRCRHGPSLLRYGAASHGPQVWG